MKSTEKERDDMRKRMQHPKRHLFPCLLASPWTLPTDRATNSYISVDGKALRNGRWLYLPKRQALTMNIYAAELRREPERRESREEERERSYIYRGEGRLAFFCPLRRLRSREHKQCPDGRYWLFTERAPLAVTHPSLVPSPLPHPKRFLSNCFPSFSTHPSFHRLFLFIYIYTLIKRY